ncbi:DUF2284 domain-containing protein [Alkalibacter mobilis]|uniref:DUF2284 domain-containing protein n=1 Tax=Alkalibacter mobilis TaxID=2787712 RepID=UPI0018A0813F|nr:DUF2284 domain-containing protein [Alkalibacter mobilis]MBF7096787.1 DUF2284 domain-containing protein [Alkalibacter mobilis]
MISREEIEKGIAKYPIFEYAFFNTDELNFYPNVRKICEAQCPQYGNSWSCPPAVGTLEECRQRCTNYKNAFIFSTISEVKDILNMEEMLGARHEHTDIVQAVHREVFGKDADVLVLTAESCEICDVCAYPDARCKYPEKMYPCIESQTILVTEICENHNMTFLNGHNVVTWFCLILY